MNFLTQDSGAVTVDWVVLTAGLVSLGLAALSVISTGVQDVSSDIDDSLTRNHIIATNFSVYQTAAVGVAQSTQAEGKVMQFGPSISAPFYNTSSPRCTEASTPDTCFVIHSYQIPIETADGEILTLTLDEKLKSTTEWEAQLLTADGDNVDPSTVDFRDMACTTVNSSVKGNTRDVCLADVMS